MNDSVMTKGVMETGRDFLLDLTSAGEMLSSYENPKDSQPELSSSMVSQSFSVPDMTFDASDSAVTEDPAYAAKGPTQWHQSDKAKKEKVWCEFCKKPYHTKENCWKLHGKPENWKSNKQGAKESAGRHVKTPCGSLNKEQLEALKVWLKNQLPSTSATPDSVSIAQTGLSGFQNSLLRSQKMCRSVL